MSEVIKEPVVEPVVEPIVEPKVEPKTNSGSNFYKQKLADVLAEKEAIKAELDESKTAKLKENDDWKQLYENEKDLRVKAQDEKKTLANSYFDGLKMSAVKEIAIKSGILDEAIGDINIKDSSLVQIETTSSGNVNVTGAENFVEKLLADRPHWFREAGAPVINNGNPEVPQTKDLSAMDLVKLEKTDPKKYAEECNKRLSVVK